MESQTTTQVLDHIKSTAPIRETKATQMAGLVKVQKASETVAGLILADTAEISEKAMNKFLAEVKG